MSRIPTEEAIKTAQHQCLQLLLEFDAVCRENNLTFWLDGGTLLGAKRHQGFIPWDDDVDLCLPVDDYLKVLEILERKSKNNPHRMLYFYKSDFKCWLDYYGDSTLLTDALFPVRIDLLPVKFIKNNEQHILIDRSLTEIASLYMRGQMKNPEAILDSHRKWLPTNQENSSSQKASFLNYFFEYAAQTSKEAQEDSEFLVNYIFNDAYVKRSRTYYKSSWIFPLVYRQNFENHHLPQPNDLNAYLTFLYGENHMTLPPEDSRVTHLKYLIRNSHSTELNMSKFIVELYNLRFNCYNLVNSKMNFVRKILHYVAFTLKLIFTGQLKFAWRFWRFNWLHRGDI